MRSKLNFAFLALFLMSAVQCAKLISPENVSEVYDLNKPYTAGEKNCLIFFGASTGIGAGLGVVVAASKGALLGSLVPPIGPIAGAITGAFAGIIVGSSMVLTGIKECKCK